MPTIRLTQLAAERLSVPNSGRTVYWDRGLPGFGETNHRQGREILGCHVPGCGQVGHGDAGYLRPGAGSRRCADPRPCKHGKGRSWSEPGCREARSALGRIRRKSICCRVLFPQSTAEHGEGAGARSS